MKKALFLLAMGLVLMSMVYGGGGQQQQAASTGGRPSMSMTILDRGSISAAEGTYANNRWTRWVNENAPVNVTFVPVIRREAVPQINRLFAAGSAPDIVYEYGKPFMDNLFGQGVIQPVGPHIERYSTAYKEYLNSVPDIKPFLIADDGQQYGISSRRTLTDLYIYGWYIRKDVLDRYNMPVPTNVDQLITFMRRFKAEDPTNVGIAFDNNLFGELRSMFGAPKFDFGVQNGNFVDWTSTPGYRDHLNFWATLYREGLMDAEYITDTNNARARQLLTTGKAAVYFGTRPSNGDGFFAKTLVRNVPTAELITMDQPGTSYGTFPNQMQETALYMACMNSNARNPQAIMSWLDWMITDGWFPLTWGQEGRHVQLQNGVPIPINLDNDTIRAEVSYIGDMAVVSRQVQQPYWFSVQNVIPNEPLSVLWGRNMEQWYARRLNDRPLMYVPYAPSSDRIRDFEAETGTPTAPGAVQAIETSIITGRLTVDEGLRQINQLKERAGWAAVNAEKTAWYQSHRQFF